MKVNRIGNFKIRQLTCYDKLTCIDAKKKIYYQKFKINKRVTNSMMIIEYLEKKKSFCQINKIKILIIVWCNVAPYSTFARDATSSPKVISFDYIIIGGGTAGCALAATLSQSFNVLLLERGDLPYGNPNITNINGFSSNLANISPSSPSQLFISTDGVFNHRARVLGGGSAINAGFFTRASDEYVKKVGWNEKLVRDSYEWVEKKVAFEPQVKQWQSAVKNGLLEVGVKPDNGFTYQHLYGTKVGGSIFDSQGQRHTAADLLEYANPTKITLLLNATVQQIMFKPAGNLLMNILLTF